MPFASRSLAARLAPLVLLAAFGAATQARGEVLTTLTVEGPSPAEPRYSQAVTFTVRLARTADDSAVAGTACTPSCSVVVEVGPEGDPATRYLVNPQGFVVDADGSRSVRIPLVDGLFDDALFAADDEGAPWTVTASFLGSGAGQANGNPECLAGGTPDADLDLCPSTATAAFPLFLETADIVLGAGLQGALGETVTLSAALTDPNGEAAVGGEDVNGPGPLDLVDREVTFFYDQDNNGRPDAAEIIDRVVTNASGVASLAFVLDPAFVRAGTYDNGIHAEFGGDGRYGVARASTPLVVAPAELDPSRTVLEVEPAEIPNDGFSKSTIRARLVDEFNNLLDETSEASVVAFETDLGILLAGVERNPNDGSYSQVLQAQRAPGTATITVIVDGVRGPSTTVEIVGEGGCTCGSATDTPFVMGALALTLLVSRVRRRRFLGARL